MIAFLAFFAMIQAAQQANPAPPPSISPIPGLPADIPASLTCPTFEFDGAAAGGTDADPIENGATTRNPIHISFAPIPVGDFGPLEVELFLQWSPNEQVLRKWARYRLIATGKPTLLKTVTLDTIDAGSAGLITNLTHDLAPTDDPQSHPVFLKGLFVGVEFPIAATRLAGDKVILAHHPGRQLQPGTWYETRKAVYGLSTPGSERAAFEKYIAAHRPNPAGLHANYNSWWTTSAHYSEAQILELMSVIDNKLARPYGVSFDTFCIDMGWSSRNGVWEIDPKMFPDGFTPIQKAAEKMNSRLGLWVSPSNSYSPRSFDNTWAMFNGYETFFSGRRRLACLAGPRYANAFRERLVEMASRYNIRHFKFDGYQCECGEANHGHEPGLLSAEPIAESIIATFAAIHQAAPDAWLETTCFGWNPSPWWLFHANSVIGTFGEDADYGRVPCPVYRESYTTGRDFFNLQGAVHLAAPISAQEVLGIVHQDPEPFLNDAVMSLMRGHMFLPVYLNPRYMDDTRWRAFAEFLKWARRHAAAIEQTTPLLPDSWAHGQVPQFTGKAAMPREPYGYAHRHAGGALIALRNPWLAPQQYRLNLSTALPPHNQAVATALPPLGKGGAGGVHSDASDPSPINQAMSPASPPHSQAASIALPPLTKGGSGGVSSNASDASPANRPFSIVSLYPEARLYAEHVLLDDTIDIPLAPYETLVLSIVPDQHAQALPPAAPKAGRTIEARISKRDINPVRCGSPEDSLGPDQTGPIGTGAFIQLTLAADVQIHAPKAELLVLVEDDRQSHTPWARTRTHIGVGLGPGQVPVAPWYQLTINGETPPVTLSSPATGFHASSRSLSEQWLFLRAPLSVGHNHIQLDLRDDRDPPRTSVWIWAYRTNPVGPANYPDLLPAPELISLDAVKLVDLADPSTSRVGTQTMPNEP